MKNDLISVALNDIFKTSQNHDVKTCFTLSAAFWILQSQVQTLFGTVGMHAGKTLPLLASVGILSTAATSAASFFVADNVIPDRRLKKKSTQYQRSDNIVKILLSVCTFCLFERRLLQTCFPSSLLTVGVYAHSRGSIASTSEIATAAQRTRIQYFGKRFGCHHCGNRQMLARKTLGLNFIADHMPPTKIVKDMNSEWWRKLLSVKIGQRLYPQCQKCFQLQGMAVKNMIHKTIFHFTPSLQHLAPAVAFLIMKDDELRESLILKVKPITAFIENIC